MAVERAALVRWTGRGEVGALRSSVLGVLRAEGVRADVRVLGASVAVVGPEPATVADLLWKMPGVSWIAAGYSVDGTQGLAEAAGKLATATLRAGKKFNVVAEGSGGSRASDLQGAALSALLEPGTGARVADGEVDVKFRVAFDGARGALGAELREGPGGATTGKARVVVLASGGAHSAVVSWMALLSGFRVTLRHGKEDEDSLLAVGRLYSELSHRVGPGALALEVVEGRWGPKDLVGRPGEGRVFGGFHPGREAPGGLGAARAPLYLMPEESVTREAEALKVRPLLRTATWKGKGKASARVLSFSGARAGVSGVVDGLRTRRPR